MKKKITALLLAVTMVLSMLTIPVSATEVSESAKLEITPSVTSVDSTGEAIKVVYTITIKPAIGQKIGAIAFTFDVPEGMELSQNPLSKSASNEGGSGYWINKKGLFYDEDEGVTSNCLKDDGSASYTVSTQRFACFGGSEEYNITASKKLMTIEATIAADQIGTFTLSANNIEVYHHNGVDLYDCTAETTALMVNGVLNGIQPVADLSAPAKLTAPDTEVTAPAHTTASVKWYCGENEVTGNFATSTQYKAVITVMPDTGYRFGSNVSFTVNGESWAVSDGQNGAKVLSKTFAATAAKELSSIAIDTAPTKTTYVVDEEFSTEGMVVTATYDDGTKETVTNYTYTPDGALAATNTNITVSYEGKTATQGITVNKKDLTRDDFTYTDGSVTYDGTDYASTVTNSIQGFQEGLMGSLSVFFKLNDSVVNQLIDAGTYKVYASTQEGTKYNASEIELGKFTISKAAIKPSVSLENWIYGETAKNPSVSGNTGNGTESFSYAAKGTNDFYDTVPTNAGEYTVKATVAESANYQGGEATADFAITKATVTAPTIAAKTYNGEKQIADVAANDLYTVTTNAGGTTVGDYNVVLTLKDSANYKWTDSEEAAKTLSFQITKATAPAVTTPTPAAVTYDPNKTLADVPLSNGWSWTDGTIVPTVKNNGYDAALTVDDANYDYTGVNGYDELSHKVTRTVPLTVNKADPTFTPPTGLSLTYDGNDQTLIQPGSTQCGELVYSLNTESYSVILPGGRDAQSYTVYYFLIGGDNYKNVRGSVTATIAKATVTAPTIAAKTYNGEKQTADVAANNLYTVTTNAGGTNVGSYDVVLTLTDSANYKWTDSEEEAKTLSFQINKATAPDVTVPTLEAVTYNPNKTLTNVTLPNGWSWTDGAIVPTVGNSGYAANLTVDDANYDYTGVDGYNAQSHKVTRVVSLTVTKADIAQAQLSGSMTVRSNTEKAVTFTLPALPEGASYGDPTVSANGDGLIGTAAPAVSGSSLSFSVTSKEKDKTATIEVPVSGGNNYNNATYTLTVTSQDKDDAGVTVAAGSSTVTYGDSLTVTGNAKSEAGSGIWTWNSNNESVITVSGNGAKPTVTVKGAGQATITGTFENDDYLGTNTVTVTVTQREVTLTWGKSSFTYDGQPHAPTVTLGNVKTDDTVIVTVTGQQTNAGNNYTATAASLDNSNYKLPEVATCAFTIAKANAAVTTAPAAVADLIYSGSEQPLLTAGTASGGTMVYSLTKDGAYSADIPTGTNAGTYTVYYKVAGDENHNDTALASVKVTIAKADASYNAPTAQELTYSGSAQALVNAGSTNDGTMQYRLGYGAWGTTVPTATKAGTYTVYYKVTGDKNHNNVAENSVTVTIGRADITPAVSMAGWTYGGKASSPSVSGNSGSGSVTYAYKVKGADDSSYTATKPTNAGDYTVKATVAQTANYNSAAATADFTIDKADASVTAAPTAKTLTYSGTAQALVKSGSASGGKMMYQLNDGEWSTAIPTATNAGTYTVHYRVDGDSNHNSVASQSVTVTIAPKAVTITANNATKVYGESDPTLTVTVTGVVSGDTVAYTVKRDEGNGVGTYAITPSGAASQGNYTVTFKTGTFTITKANASVTSAPQAVTDLKFTGEAQELVTAGQAEGGELQYKLGNGAYGTNIPEATEAGTYTVYYKVVGDANHNNVSEARITVTIAPLSGNEVVTSGNVTASTQPDDTINELSKLEQYQTEALGLEENPTPEQVAAARLEAIRKDMTKEAGTSDSNASALYYVVNTGSSLAKVTFALPASAATHNFKVMYMAANGAISQVTNAKVTASGIEVPVAADGNGDGVYLVAYTPKPVHVVDDSASASGDQSIITDLTDINKVTVDGKTVNPKNYTVSGGVVTLSEAYVRTLSNGKHTVRVENAKYISTAVITVSNSTVKSAGTGDAGLGLYAMLALSSVTGAAWLGLKKRKED